MTRVGEDEGPLVWMYPATFLPAILGENHKERYFHIGRPGPFPEEGVTIYSAFRAPNYSQLRRQAENRRSAECTLNVGPLLSISKIHVFYEDRYLCRYQHYQHGSPCPLTLRISILVPICVLHALCTPYYPIQYTQLKPRTRCSNRSPSSRSRMTSGDREAWKL